MCLTPVTIKVQTPLKNQWGFEYIEVPCGKCPKCLRTRQNSWAFRLTEHLKHSLSGYFITLTYDEDHLPLTDNGLPTVKRKHYQLFMKKLRKNLKPGNYGLNYKYQMPKLKYYMVGEYGSKTQRPHYHAIMYNLPLERSVALNLLEQNWDYGHVDIGDVNIKSCRYVASYCISGTWKPQHDYETGLIDDRIPHFSGMSQGLGKDYLTPQMVKWHVSNMIGSVELDGKLLNMPRYLKDKIFSPMEKKEMALEALKIRDYKFDKLFQNDYKKELTWKKDQFRKHQKLVSETNSSKKL